jgi:integrase
MALGTARGYQTRWSIGVGAQEQSFELLAHVEPAPADLHARNDPAARPIGDGGPRHVQHLRDLADGHHVRSRQPAVMRSYACVRRHVFYDRRAAKAGHQERLEVILSELGADTEHRDDAGQLGTLLEATQGWVAERKRDKDLKRSTARRLRGDVRAALSRPPAPTPPSATSPTGACGTTSTTSSPTRWRSRDEASQERERVLRRDDFYDTEEIALLFTHAPTVFEEAFWLCGAHAGFRLPGEALGLRWGAVDFTALVLRPYDNWVRGQLDTTKTSDCEAIPMTPRLARALATLKQREYATGDEDFVFVSEPEPERPVRDKPLREAFKIAREKAGLKPIKMYNLRHSFGTRLAANGVDVRTIQALMRHARLNTTEQYMAYAPRPELANQITRALDPHSLPENVIPLRPSATSAPATLLERLAEEIPAKWLREIERILAEGNTEPPAVGKHQQS